MIKHIVMWKFREGAEGKTRRESACWMKEQLEKLVGIVPEIYSLEVGVNTKDDEMAYDAVLITTLEDEAAMKRYKIHPEHVKISNYCKKLRESRTVVDYEI
ncbi:MAG: Dabb family protein [Tannerellaceae bacterium]|nr:Dabb family protein [Tannerellaceae bacterium]